jgi:hypothetical protein
MNYTVVATQTRQKTLPFRDQYNFLSTTLNVAGELS